MSDFCDRPRFELGKILEYLHNNKENNAICHVLSNEDGTYSMMTHIVCEYCDYCESQGDCRDIFSISKIVPAKEDPYELQNAAIAEWEADLEWYGEEFKYAFNQ